VTIKPSVEVMTLNPPQWVECLSGADSVQSITLPNVGPGPRGNKPRDVDAKFVFTNKNQTMNPQIAGGPARSTKLEVKRRIRVKLTGPSMGNVLQMIHSGPAGSINAYQTVTVSGVANDVFLFTLPARAQFDSCYNAVKATITSSGGDTNSIIFYFTNRYATYTIPLVLTASCTTVTVSLTPMTPGNGQNTSAIEFRKLVLQKNGGANLLTNGDFASGSTSPWSVTTVTGATLALAVISDYEIRFNGRISNVSPAAHQLAGDLTTTVRANDFTAQTERTTVRLPLQKNKTSDQIGRQLLQLYDGGYSSNVLLDKPRRYYRTNDLTGTVTTDLGADGQNSTYTGGFSLNQPIPLAGDATAYGVKFDGSSGYISMPTINLGQTSFTLECLAYFTSLANTPVIFAAFSAAAQDQSITWQVYPDGHVNCSLFSDDVASAAGTIVINTWYHLGFVFDYPSSTIKLYVNGVLNSSGTPHGPISVSTFAWINWGANGGANWLTGTLAECAAYNVALSASDFQRHYQAAQGYYNVLRIPGKQIDPDTQVFGKALDGYTQNRTYLDQAMTDTATSGYLRWYFDLDGTARLLARVDAAQRMIPSSVAPQVPAATTATFAAQPSDGNTFTVNTTIYTYKTALTSTPNQILIGASASVTAANTAAAITGASGAGTKYSNNSSAPYGVTAQAAATVVTLTATVPGKYGNSIAVSVSNPASIVLANSTLVGGVDEFLNANPVLVAQDGQSTGLTVERDEGTLRNQIALTIHPRDQLTANQVIGYMGGPLTIPPMAKGASDTLYGANRSAQGQPSKPGQLTLTLTFRDPTTQQPCGGDNVVIPVPVTDYTVYTNIFAVPLDSSPTTSPNVWISDVNIAASQITMTFNNTLTNAVYLEGLQVRGTAIVQYNPIDKLGADNVSVNENGEALYAKDLPYASDGDQAASLASYLLGRYAWPFAEATTLIVSNKSTLNGVDLTTIRLMDVIKVSDVQTGMSNVLHLVTGITQELAPDSPDVIRSMTLELERMDDSTFWILGHPTYGQLDSTTRLFI
jgi:Concanavalin A-like lectin/glucanases superfamily